MGIGSAFAVYLLIWMVTLFVVLPFGVRTPSDEGRDAVTGHADSAPIRPMLAKKLLWNSVLSAIIFGLLWLNYKLGWITPDMLPSY
ncbi:DUF1467 family protein [Pacificimonas sp. WHA3]|uniref:DUF1467 family protein n=1 Tax=Pacificimonas pallii TaxID=2827236 RepID=A0ABS6SE52_9SPHN|nr:DUF1467 family protein [Pacificimonas pallii]MBV7256689.1 DUF1467 family protein [Pacificimonas pallii]